MRKKYFSIIILLIYYVATVLPHEFIGLAITDIFSAFSRNTYNRIIGVLVLTFLIIFIIWFWKKTKTHPKKTIINFYALTTLLFILFCFQILFVNNIEAIHFFQYAFFAILCFRITENIHRTMIISTLAGFFDELFQYLILAPETSDYYDFNDVVINTVGVGAGLLIIRVMQWNYNCIPLKKLILMPEVIISLSLILIFIIGQQAGYFFVLLDPDNPTAFSLLKKLPEFFWTEFPNQNIKYHILLPVSGITITFLLWCFYFPLGLISQTRESVKSII